MSTSHNSSETNPNVDPTAVVEDQALDAVTWMSALMRARMIGDFPEAQEALERLHELGVVVRFRRGPKLGGHAAAEEVLHGA